MKSIFRISFMIILICCLIFLVGCTDKEAKQLTDAGYSVPIGETKASNEFTDILDDLGYDVQDDTEVFAEQLELPLEAYISASNEQIMFEYIICKDAETAGNVYFNKVSDLDAGVTPGMFTLNSATDEYVKDIYDNDETFTCIVLVDKTVLLAVSDSEYSEDVSSVFKELGY